MQIQYSFLNKSLERYIFNMKELNICYLFIYQSYYQAIFINYSCIFLFEQIFQVIKSINACYIYFMYMQAYINFNIYMHINIYIIILPRLINQKKDLPIIPLYIFYKLQKKKIIIIVITIFVNENSLFYIHFIFIFCRHANWGFKKQKNGVNIVDNSCFAYRILAASQLLPGHQSTIYMYAYVLLYILYQQLKQQYMYLFFVVVPLFRVCWVGRLCVCRVNVNYIPILQILVFLGVFSNISFVFLTRGGGQLFSVFIQTVVFQFYFIVGGEMQGGGGTYVNVTLIIWLISPVCCW
eukprot:TRINITY_DN5698_c1_g1_i7.p3 TRINITY_DN5698_c1_g1~~TRINITY_DN5698_c1_g1_i7.p3  ORF type:complete len:295 (+),score=-9.52 TRINITY_DN5698_c1_g1_i7:1173-2057(+)